MLDKNKETKKKILYYAKLLDEKGTESKTF